LSPGRFRKPKSKKLRIVNTWIKATLILKLIQIIKKRIFFVN
jgi:hypothetical protein